MYLFYLMHYRAQHALFQKKNCHITRKTFVTGSSFVLQNHMSWANFLTFTTACTLIVINVCTEIGNCDCLGRTVLLTFFTANTTKLAGSCNCLTFCVGAAGYTYLFVIWYQFDQVTRTFGNTFAAGFTCLLIYNRNTIHYMDRIKRTCLYTASEAHTSECTVFCTAAWDESHHLAVFHTCVFIFHGRLITGSRHILQKQPDVPFLLLPVP
mgnify:CR=1 FL=1